MALDDNLSQAIENNTNEVLVMSNMECHLCVRHAWIRRPVATSTRSSRHSAKRHIRKAKFNALRKGEEGFMAWVTEELADFNTLGMWDSDSDSDLFI